MIKEELVIWVDHDNNELGKVPRDLVHDKNHLMLHRETMELLFRDKEHTEFLLQKRSSIKEQFPNRWTLTATCHVNPVDITINDPGGFLNSGARESIEEVGVVAKNQKLICIKSIETPLNRAMAGVIVGEYEGIPIADPKEVSEIRLFNRETVLEIKDQLTPGALICLVLLGILQNEEKTE